MSRAGWYVVANLGFCALVGLGMLTGSAPQVHAAYLVLLFALCSTPIMNFARLNDRYALLAGYLLVYFFFYGVGDFISLFGFGAMPLGTVDAGSNGPISKPEWVILAGCASALIAYRSICNTGLRSVRRPAKDWPEATLVWGGLGLWILCTYLSWEFNVRILQAPTNAAVEHGLGSLSTLATTGYILTTVLLQPLSIVILAYAAWRFQRRYMLPVLLMVVFTQLLLGFASDGKERALIGGVLVLATKVLVEGRLPKVWIAVAVAFLTVSYPVLQANRYVRNSAGLDRTQVVQNLGKLFEQALSSRKEATTGEDRVPSFLERVSLKSAVELIVARTGVDVKYQHGRTLTPLWLAFIPRLIWPSKPDVEAGQVLNHEFQISPVADTYISPSHLGELYWNFGWAGVVVGMALIGLLLGFISARCNLAESMSITRMMLLAVTIFFVVIRSEGSIANEYVNWVRSVLAIGVLHGLLARPVFAEFPAAQTQPDGAYGSVGTSRMTFPNLLR